MSNRNFDKLKKSFQNQNTDKEDVSRDNVPLPKPAVKHEDKKDLSQDNVPLLKPIVKHEKKKDSPSKKKERINYALFPNIEGDELYRKNLNLKWKSGRKTSFPYDYKPFVDFAPDLGSITLSSSLIVVVIKGLRLERLFDYLAEHQVDWLKESEGEDTNRSETHISEIIIHKNHD